MSNRALIIVRLSAARDNSTSPERQLEHCRMTLGQRGLAEVDVAEDLAVSATKYSPFERPSLGHWLCHRSGEFDTLVCWRLDRIIRSSRDLADLLAWCDSNGKGFVSATEGFDLSTPFGRAMVAIIAALGQLEAETTATRVADAHAKLRTTDRWASGVPPLGFQTAPHPSGSGYALVTDPDAKRLLHDMAEKLLDGWSLTRITEWLNESGELSAMDRVRVPNGKERRGWTTSNVTRILTSPATQGMKIKAHKGKSGHPGTPMLDEDGLPIQMAPPTFDTETWEQIQAAVKARRMSGRRRTHTSNPMVGVGVCGECGKTLAQQFTNSKPLKDGTVRTYRTYRCSRTPTNCHGVMVRAETADELLEGRFLELHGDSLVVEQRFVPGTDNREDIERTRGALDRLRAESDAGLISDDDEYMSRLKSLSDRLSVLEAEPYRASRWEAVETTQTYSEAWERSDAEHRRKILMDAGVRFVLYQGSPLVWELQTP